jgi:hypothetical protein
MAIATDKTVLTHFIEINCIIGELATDTHFSDAFLLPHDANASCNKIQNI